LDLCPGALVFVHAGIFDSAHLIFYGPSVLKKIDGSIQQSFIYWLTMDRKAGPFSFPLPDNSLELTGRENSMKPSLGPPHRGDRKRGRVILIQRFGLYKDRYMLESPKALSTIKKIPGSLVIAGIFDSAHLIFYGPSVLKKINPPE